MFCNQCEQTAKGTGCTTHGVCGKDEYIADLQDLIVYALRGLAITALQAAEKGEKDMECGRLCVRGLFSTVTNVNFDRKPLREMLDSIVKARDALAKKTGMTPDLPVTTFVPAESDEGLADQHRQAATTQLAPDADRNALAQTLLYGLKGTSAYADHASILGQEKWELYEAIYKGLAFGFDGKDRTLDEWIAEVLECGRTNFLAMELLDAGNTGTYGHPEPTEVALEPKPGKAILVTGHDLKDLHDLLVQTEGKGINIYTHGEMLPAHGYPELKKFMHLAGHFGTAWQNQQKEFPEFPGPILFTTNCIQKPAANYIDRVYTTGLVGWPGVKHVQNGDFGALIEAAEALPGYTEDDETRGSRPVMVGFGHNTIKSVANKVLECIRAGRIRHIFLVGGCDGAKPGRNYYTEFVEKTPDDSLVLTLACGKFRFFDKELGDIGGIPRLLDVGQCNDAYSAVVVAKALADGCGCEINELPLSLILSWYEQKAVAILLSLLALGVTGIRLGPTLPAFVTPAVLDVLVKTFDIKPITTPDEDLKAILG